MTRLMMAMALAGTSMVASAQDATSGRDDRGMFIKAGLRNFGITRIFAMMQVTTRTSRAALRRGERG